MRGRFRVNITAPIVIRMAITSHAGGIAIDLIYKLRREELRPNVATLPALVRSLASRSAVTGGYRLNGPRCRSSHRAK